MTTDGCVDGRSSRVWRIAARRSIWVRPCASGPRVLEMEGQDLQLLPLPQSDDSYHLFLYDPMPVGSGLLQQLLEQWEGILSVAAQTLSACESQCQQSCYNCTRTYRNVFYHNLLDRHRAVE